MNKNAKQAIRVTRTNGLSSILGAGAERNFMVQVLNKADKDVVKVERGTLEYGQDDEGNTIKVFTPTETIWQSKQHATSELAQKALELAADSENKLAEVMAEKELQVSKNAEMANEIELLKAQLAKVNGAQAKAGSGVGASSEKTNGNQAKK